MSHRSSNEDHPQYIVTSNTFDALLYTTRTFYTVLSFSQHGKMRRPFLSLNIRRNSSRTVYKPPLCQFSLHIHISHLQKRILSLFVLAGVTALKLSLDSQVSAFIHVRPLNTRHYCPPWVHIQRDSPKAFNHVVRMTSSSSVPKEEQETLVQNNTSTSPFNLLPRLSFKKNKNSLKTNSTNNTTEATPTLLEKAWFYRKRLRSLNSTFADIKDTNRGRGFFSRLLQYIPLLPKSSGESLLDTEVQLTQTFGNTNVTSSSSSSTTPPKKNTAQDNIPPPDTRINSFQTDSNYLIDLFFSIPYWFKESIDSITASMRNSRDEEWVTVCPKTQVSPGAIVPVIAGGINLLIIASKDGKRVYCVANSCSHLGTPLETGMLEQRPISYKTSLKSTLVKRKSLSTGGMVSSPTVFNSTDVEGSSEACIVCPLHRTAFALESGEVRGPWCPYPPIIGAMVGLVKPITKLPTFAIRTRGKNIEVLINSRVNEMDAE